LARNPRGENWRERLQGRPGWHSRTVVRDEEKRRLAMTPITSITSITILIWLLTLI